MALRCRPLVQRDSGGVAERLAACGSDVCLGARSAFIGTSWASSAVRPVLPRAMRRHRKPQGHHGEAGRLLL